MKGISEQSAQDWATPRWFLQAMGIQPKLDVCATKETTTAKRFFTKKDNGLEQYWEDDWWCNPPWNDIESWVDCARSQVLQAQFGWFLVPARTETRWFRKLVEISYRVEFIYPRLNYWCPRRERIVSGISVGSALFHVNHDQACEFSFIEVRKPKDATR